jgi:ABC-type phosphonate transport system ATPase subunit
MAGLGLLGLQWSGVTTTLRCLCGTSIAADAGQGIADVHDPRLGELARVSESKRMVAATL